MFGATSVPSLTDPQKPKPPMPEKSLDFPAPTGLFDDDDGDDDFFSASCSKSSKTGRCLFQPFYEFCHEIVLTYKGIKLLYFVSHVVSEYLLKHSCQRVVNISAYIGMVIWGSLFYEPIFSALKTNY